MEIKKRLPTTPEPEPRRSPFFEQGPRQQGQVENDPKIINLSPWELTAMQKKVLLRGLKFTPTPGYNEKEVKSDIAEFSRKLRLKEYFHNRDISDDSLVRNKSNFTPEKGRDPHLDTYIDYINKVPVGKKVGKHIKSNLSKAEKQALKSIREKDDIIIKEADKGSAIVIMPKTYYEEKILDMLNDNETYKQINQNQDRYILNKIKQLAADPVHDLSLIHI